jgi:asparagine synthase (glutamine-hydrolysing)
MCGIAGFISPHLNQEHLHHNTRALQHRGPDAEGFYFETKGKYNVGLGHRRLAIIDLSSAGNQPMYSHCGRFIMVYNGEVYNYEEIRSSKFNRYLWRSSSDSEVILESFAKFGSGCFEWFNGIFAIAIWDTKENKLTLARDHAGIKPLYYFYKNNEVLFASELKGFGAIQKKLSFNLSVIPGFLHVGYIPHPYSIYNEIKKIESGSYTEISIDSSENLSQQNQSFWKVQDKISSAYNNNGESAKRELDTLLTDAISKQLMSDVPIGTFLSGGTDSSIVTAIASKVSANKINSYSIAVTDGKINEAPYAAAVAKHLGTNHHELPITQKEMLELVPEFMNVYDEPFTDSSAFPTMLVSKLARKHVTVTLSGDGGDELFLGYGSYQWAKRLQNPLLKLAAPLIHEGSRFLNNRYKRAGMLFQKHPAAHFKSHLFSQDQYFFSEMELNKLLVNPVFNLSGINYDFTGRSLSIEEQMSFWDIENYLKDDLLVKVDRASMHYGLETRVPLLDFRVIEFALNLSPSLKIDDKGSMKYLLKQVLYDYVPKTLLERPKWGFSIPLSKWLKTDLKWMVEKYCSREIIENAGIVRYQEVERLVKLYQKGKNDYLYNRIWTLIILHWFLHEHS